MNASRWAVFPALALFLCALGCAPAPSLTVQLRSDLVPGAEVDRAFVQIAREGATVDSANHDLLGIGSLGRPIRLRELEGLVEGTYDVRVSLERAGAMVAERHVRVRVAGATIATVLISRHCEGVVCMDGTSDTSTSCVGSRCEPLGCTEEHPELCTARECMRDADCAASVVPCVQSTCTPSGTCFDAAVDTLCMPGQVCSTLIGCTAPQSVFFDLAAGLAVNSVNNAGDGRAVTQHGAEGWWYEYDPVMAFQTVGALDAAAMDPTRYHPMEMARTTPWGGWFANAGLQVGQRGVVTFADWSMPGTSLAAAGDSIQVQPENSVQVVVEWRAPAAGRASIALDLSPFSNAGGDVEAHLFVRHAGIASEIGYEYFSQGGTADDYGQPTVIRNETTPAHLAATMDLAAGDSYFLYVRVGDNDAGDGATIRGGVGFVTAP